MQIFQSTVYFESVIYALTRMFIQKECRICFKIEIFLRVSVIPYTEINIRNFFRSSREKEVIKWILLCIRVKK